MSFFKSLRYSTGRPSSSTVDEKRFEEFLTDTVKNELTKKTLRLMPENKKSVMMEEWEKNREEMPRSFGTSPELLEMVEVDGIGKIPRVLEYLKSELMRKGGLRKMGIFRVAGEETVVRDIKFNLNKHRYVKCESCHDSATLIKIWFRELPSCLFDHFSTQFFQEIDAKDEGLVEGTVDQLPQQTQNLLSWVLNLCMLVEENSRVNKMTVTNLAIVFSPNFYTKKGKSPRDVMMMTSKMSQFFTTLLEIKIREKQGDDIQSEEESGEEEIIMDDEESDEQPQEEDEEDEEGEQQQQDYQTGYLLYDYDHEDVSVKKDEYVTILSVVDEYSYVTLESGQDCYVPSNYIEIYHQSEENLQESERQEPTEEEEEDKNRKMLEDASPTKPEKSLPTRPQKVGKKSLSDACINKSDKDADEKWEIIPEKEQQELKDSEKEEDSLKTKPSLSFGIVNERDIRVSISEDSNRQEHLKAIKTFKKEKLRSSFSAKISSSFRFFKKSILSNDILGGRMSLRKVQKQPKRPSRRTKSSKHTRKKSNLSSSSSSSSYSKPLPSKSDIPSSQDSVSTNDESSNELSSLSSTTTTTTANESISTLLEYGSIRESDIRENFEKDEERKEHLEKIEEFDKSRLRSVGSSILSIFGWGKKKKKQKKDHLPTRPKRKKSMKKEVPVRPKRKKKKKKKGEKKVQVTTSDDPIKEEKVEPKEEEEIEEEVKDENVEEDEDVKKEEIELQPKEEEEEEEEVQSEPIVTEEESKEDGEEIEEIVQKDDVEEDEAEEQTVEKEENEETIKEEEDYEHINTEKLDEEETSEIPEVKEELETIVSKEEEVYEEKNDVVDESKEDEQEQEESEEEQQQQETEKVEEETATVENQLKKHGFEKHIPIFLEEMVTLDQFSSLTSGELKELGLRLGERKRFLTNFQQI